MNLCDSKDCGDTARWIAFWPGQTTMFCDRCLSRARAVAEAMGFELSYRDWVEWAKEVDAFLTATDARRRLGG
jgi:hypothetical protein